MVRRHAGIEHAYEVLGLEQGTPLEQIKTTYKQLALKTHPDRNPDNPEATAKFQELGGAYATLLKHFEKPSASHMHSRGPDSDFEDEDFDYDSASDDGIYRSHPSFFFFIFEEMLNGRTPHIHIRRGNNNNHHETGEEYQARLKAQREERQAAEERRREEERRRKARIQEDRERERVEAERRQQERAAQRKTAAENEKLEGARRVREQLKKVQKVRSAAFAAARRGDVEAVKRAVFEESVDASGGEVRKGADEFVAKKPKDDKETLLHIAAGRGDLELFEWLVDHNAEPDECNSAGLTALHVALQGGRTLIVQYVFKNLPPSDSDHHGVYAFSSTAQEAHSGMPNILSLALHTAIPELVWLVLENKLATSQQISEAYSWLRSSAGTKIVKGACKTSTTLQRSDELMEELENILIAYGAISDSDKAASAPATEELSSASAQENLTRLASVNPHVGLPTPTSTASVDSTSARGSPSPLEDGWRRQGGSQSSRGTQKQMPRGRGRGRARGRGRGAGDRGRGRGVSQQ